MQRERRGKIRIRRAFPCGVAIGAIRYRFFCHAPQRCGIEVARSEYDGIGHNLRAIGEIECRLFTSYMAVQHCRLAMIEVGNSL